MLRGGLGRLGGAWGRLGECLPDKVVLPMYVCANKKSSTPEYAAPYTTEAVTDSEGSEDLGCFSSEEKAAEAANEWLDDCAKECLKAGLATWRSLRTEATLFVGSTASDGGLCEVLPN